MDNPVMQSDKPTLCVINFNGASFLPDSLAAAAAQRNSFAEVVVIDNASEDDSVALIERNFSWVRILRMSKNGGPAIARNAGYRTAKTDLVLFIDNDVSIAEGCVSRLVEALERNPKAAVAAPRVLYAYNPTMIQYDGADNHFLGLMVFHNQDRPLADADKELRSVGSVTTACCLVDRTRLPDDDPFDDTFFIYVEDHDFTLRVRILGMEIMSVPQAICYHAEGTKGLSLRSLGKYSKMRVFCLIRNRWQLLLKNYSMRSLILFAPLLLLFETAQFIIAAKKGWLGEWMRAFGWVVVHLPGILAARRRIQRSRKTPDRAILVGGPVPFRGELTESGFEHAARRVLDVVTVAYWRAAQRLI